ncbi:MAG TPA: hypothetical protein VGC86_17465 [Afipia sp.]
MRIFLLVTLAFFGSVNCTFAQGVIGALGNFDEVYPNSLYVTPQDSSFVAPGIYRSVSARKFTNPIAISRICTKDFRETAALKSLPTSTSQVAGLSLNLPYKVTVGIDGLKWTVVSGGGNVDYQDSATLTMSPIQAIEADDDVADDVLAGIGPKCKKLILSHLKQRRVIFVGQKAIQANELTLTSTRGLKAGANVSCGLFCGGAKLQGSYDGQKVFTRSSKTPVTVAIVPGLIDGDHYEVRTTDLK